MARTYHLRYDGNTAPQCVKIHRRGRQSIVENFSFRDDTPQQRQGQGTLSTPGASNYTHSLTRLYLEIEIMQHAGAILNSERERQCIPSLVHGRDKVLTREYRAQRPSTRSAPLDGQ